MEGWCARVIGSRLRRHETGVRIAAQPRQRLHCGAFACHPSLC
jgi:hypothetical protein